MMTTCLSSDFKKIAAGYEDGTVKFYSVNNSRPFYEKKIHTKNITSLHFSNDCNYFASASEDLTAKVTDLKN